jgi:hypothetical protein
LIPRWLGAWRTCSTSPRSGPILLPARRSNTRARSAAAGLLWRSIPRDGRGV